MTLEAADVLRIAMRDDSRLSAGPNSVLALERFELDATTSKGEIARRPVPDFVVIGHTDRVGSDAFKDTLSRQRAEVVRNALLARAMAPDKVTAVGRGKREPIVPTADSVAEPRNRRVEIQVR